MANLHSERPRLVLGPTSRLVGEAQGPGFSSLGFLAGLHRLQFHHQSMVEIVFLIHSHIVWHTWFQRMLMKVSPFFIIAPFCSRKIEFVTCSEPIVFVCVSLVVWDHEWWCQTMGISGQVSGGEQRQQNGAPFQHHYFKYHNLNNNSNSNTI